MISSKTYISIVIVACCAAGIGAFAFINHKDTTSPSVVVSASTSTAATSSTQSLPIQPTSSHSTSTQTIVVTTTAVDTPKKKIAYTYKNGTYTATASYDSPAGKESIGVSITLVNDIIADATVTPMAKDKTSDRYQDMFVSGYKTYVIGKDISTLQLGAVSGSSLTPVGFNNALTQIKAQARV